MAPQVVHTARPRDLLAEAGPGMEFDSADGRLLVLVALRTLGRRGETIVLPALLDLEAPGADCLEAWKAVWVDADDVLCLVSAHPLEPTSHGRIGLAFVEGSRLRIATDAGETVQRPLALVAEPALHWAPKLQTVAYDLLPWFAYAGAQV